MYTFWNLGTNSKLDSKPKNQKCIFPLKNKINFFSVIYNYNSVIFLLFLKRWLILDWRSSTKTITLMYRLASWAHLGTLLYQFLRWQLTFLYTTNCWEKPPTTTLRERKQIIKKLEESNKIKNIRIYVEYSEIREKLQPTRKNLLKFLCHSHTLFHCQTKVSPSKFKVLLTEIIRK